MKNDNVVIQPNSQKLNRDTIHRKLADSIDQILIIWDFKGHIIDVNQAAIQAYGYTYDEFCRLNIKNIVNDLEDSKSLINNLTQLHQTEQFHLRKDGSIFAIQIKTQVLTIDDEILRVGFITMSESLKHNQMGHDLDEKTVVNLIKQAPFGIAFLKINGDVIDCNERFETILGRSLEELKRLDWRSYTHPDDIEKDMEYFDAYFSENGDAFTTYKRYFKPDGSTIWAEVTVIPFEMNNQPTDLNVLIFKDMTEHIVMQEELSQSNQFKDMVLSNIQGMVFRCDNDEFWTMRFISKGCEELTGYPPESLILNRDLTYDDIINQADRKILREAWEVALENHDNFKAEYQIITANNEKKWVLERGHGIYDEVGNVIALEGLIIDISERKQKEDEILYLTYNDALTGVYNRRYFDIQLKELNKKENLPISIILGDINGLKQINESLGHFAGDQLLVDIAKILDAHVSKPGFVARISGDDFSMLLPTTSRKEGDALKKKIDCAIETFIKTSKYAIYHASVSLGSATKTTSDGTLLDTIKKAEDNMLRTKMLQKESTRSYALASLKAALFEKSEETEAHALRLVELSRAIGHAMQLSDEELNELELLAMLHDIGKIGISDTILNKPGKLTAHERAQINRHPEIGYRIAMTSKELIPIAQYILCHHERYDGQGYPRKIKGEDIPLLSRIIAVVDAFDAMTSDRPYRQALTKTQAIQEVKANAGTQFDPNVVEIFLKVINQ